MSILLIAVLNLAIAAARFFFCLRARRLLSVSWFLIAYFSFFFLPVVYGGPFKHFQAFTATNVQISAERIASTCHYMFAFNLIFLVSEWLFWRLVGVRNKNITWQLPVRSKVLDRLSLAYLAMLIPGALLYGIATWRFGYSDFVSGENQSSWSLVFLFASTPYISIAALRRQYIRATIASLPFIYFAVQMQIRSFALLSLIPVAIVYLLQTFASDNTNLLKKIKFLLFFGSMAGFLILSSALLLQNKPGQEHVGFSLPDSGMPFGATIMMEVSDKSRIRTEWDAVTLYALHLVNPFVKICTKFFNMPEPDIVDPPYVMARAFDGIPKNFPTGLHYPALWYADAYFAFGNYGLFFAILWAAVLIAFEAGMTRNVLLFGLLLPFYTWHTYMIIRGAIAGATVPFTYGAYISFIAAFIIVGVRLSVKVKGTQNPALTRAHKANLDISLTATHKQ